MFFFVWCQLCSGWGWRDGDWRDHSPCGVHGQSSRYVASHLCAWFPCCGSSPGPAHKSKGTLLSIGHTCFFSFPVIAKQQQITRRWGLLDNTQCWLNRVLVPEQKPRQKGKLRKNNKTETWCWRSEVTDYELRGSWTMEDSPWGSRTCRTGCHSPSGSGTVAGDQKNVIKTMKIDY